VVGDLFRMGLSTTSIIVRECCNAIMIQFSALVFKKPNPIWMKLIAKGIKALYGISLILRATDSNHIHIVAPSHNQVAFYC